MLPSLTAPKDCLAFHLARPLCVARAVKDAPCAMTAQSIDAYLSKEPDKHYSPEIGAFTFYVLQQAVADARRHFHLLEPLPPAVLGLVNAYHEKAAALAMRNFAYLVLICTREMRHLKNKTAIKDEALPLFGKEAVQYLGSIPDDPSSAQTQFASSPPKTSLGNYAGALAYAFHNGSWAGGYGGPAWGAIADCLLNYVNGTYSPEIMLDVVWTLCHNNGPIYNKGICFAHYNGSALLTILDAQRAGMIPQLVKTASAYSLAPYVTEEMLQWVEALWSFSPPTSEMVDWEKVMSLGAKGHYHGYIGKPAKSAKAPSLPPNALSWGPSFTPIGDTSVKTVLLKRAA